MTVEKRRNLEQRRSFDISLNKRGMSINLLFSSESTPDAAKFVLEPEFDLLSFSLGFFNPFLKSALLLKQSHVLRTQLNKGVMRDVGWVVLDSHTFAMSS